MGGDVILAHVYILLYIKLICTVTYILTYTVYKMVWGTPIHIFFIYYNLRLTLLLIQRRALTVKNHTQDSTLGYTNCNHSHSRTTSVISPCSTYERVKVYWRACRCNCKNT